MCTNTMKLQMVSTKDLRPAGFNPDERIELDKLGELMGSIRKYGILRPLHVAKDMLIADGHRRWACALALDIPEVPCIVMSLALQEAWIALNITRVLSGRDMVSAANKGLSSEYMPDRWRKQIEELRLLAGGSLEDVATYRVAPHILSVVKQVAKYTDDKSEAWQSTILRWLMENQMQNPARMFMKLDPLGEQRQVLADTIRRNRPLRFAPVEA